MACTSSNNRRRKTLPGKAAGSGIDYGSDSSRPACTTDDTARGADSLPRPAALVGNSELWAKLWVKWGAPNTAEWWANCHHMVLRRLEPFIKEYLAAEDKYAVLERWGL